MGDLKTNWTDPVLPDHGVDGQGVVSRGTDPNVDGGGEGGLQSPWPTDKYATTKTETAESANSVSGLPAQPNRFEPSEGAPEIPTLQDRNPGTIDKQ